MDEINLQMLNCVWDNMKGATWFSENNEFTLYYVCVNESASKCVESVYILDRGEVVDSDHSAVEANVKWKVKRKGQCRTKGLGSFWNQMARREY